MNFHILKNCDILITFDTILSRLKTPVEAPTMHCSDFVVRIHTTPPPSLIKSIKEC
jgi:hypothetical protein